MYQKCVYHIDFVTIRVYNTNDAEMRRIKKKGRQEMNVLKLKGRMVEKGLTVKILAETIRMDRGTLYRKLNRCESITVGEMQRIMDALGLTKAEAIDIFFD